MLESYTWQDDLSQAVLDSTQCGRVTKADCVRLLDSVFGWQKTVDGFALSDSDEFDAQLAAIPNPDGFAELAVAFEKINRLRLQPGGAN